MNMSRILSRIMLGRLLLLVIITAPPAACTRASEEIDPTALQTVERGPVTLSVIADSETISAGTPLEVEIRVTAQDRVEITTPLASPDEEGFFGDFNVLEIEERPDYPEGTHRIWSQALVLDSFESGPQAIPAISVHYTDRRGDIEITGTIETEAIPITVNGALGTAADAGGIRDIRGPVEIPLVNWVLWILLGGSSVILAGASIALLVVRRRARVVPEVLPHELARQRLDELESEGLLEQKCFQPFYFRLTDILRHYIEGRFGMLAPTSTTSEFLHDMDGSALLEGQQQERLRGFLRFSDLVKFALHEPPVEEGHEALVMARSFVEETVPRIEPELEETT